MKKIIAAFDSLKFSGSTRDYAIWLAKHNSADLSGVFLEDHSGYRTYDLLREKGGLVGSAKKKLTKKDMKKRAVAVKNFETACHSAGIDYTIYHDRENAIHDLLLESIYGDLLVIDSKETLTNDPEKTPTPFIRHLLSQVQCPVWITPQSFKPVNKLTLLYDGQPSSVYAFKMFSYVLPALLSMPAEVITVHDPKQPPLLPKNGFIKEFMKGNFPQASFTVLKGLPEAAIVEYLKNQKEAALVILGGYQRGWISRWFRASMADTLMSELKLPLFIAQAK